MSPAMLFVIFRQGQMARRSAMARLGATIAISLVLGAVATVVGCGSSDDSTFGNGNGDGNGGAGSSGQNGFSSSGASGSTPTPPCVGLQCQQVACSGGGTTSL